MNKHQLASTIWESANQMRSKIEANEYHAMLSSEKAADKRDERASKCMVPGKRSGLIMCRESSCRRAQAEGRCPIHEWYSYGSSAGDLH